MKGEFSEQPEIPMKMDEKEGHGKSSFSHLKSWITTHHTTAEPGMPIAPGAGL